MSYSDYQYDPDFIHEQEGLRSQEEEEPNFNFMALKTLKSLWQENKLAMYNRRPEATFEALKLLWGQDTFTFDDIDSNKPCFEVNNWQGMRKTKHFEWFCCEENSSIGDFDFILEPAEVLKIFKS